jgi:hypothetical protein
LKNKDDRKYELLVKVIKNDGASVLTEDELDELCLLADMVDENEDDAEIIEFDFLMYGKVIELYGVEIENTNANDNNNDEDDTILKISSDSKICCFDNNFIQVHDKEIFLKSLENHKFLRNINDEINQIIKRYIEGNNNIKVKFHQKFVDDYLAKNKDYIEYAYNFVFRDSSKEDEMTDYEKWKKKTKSHNSFEEWKYFVADNHLYFNLIDDEKIYTQYLREYIDFIKANYLDRFYNRLSQKEKLTKYNAQFKAELEELYNTLDIIKENLNSF